MTCSYVTELTGGVRCKVTLESENLFCPEHAVIVGLKFSDSRHECLEFCVNFCLHRKFRNVELKYLWYLWFCSSRYADA